MNTAVEKLHMADLLIFTESNRDETGINTVSSITAMLNILAVGTKEKGSEGGLWSALRYWKRCT